MPIKTHIDGEISYLESYTAYRLPEGDVPCDLIDEMISYTPERVHKVEYHIGSLTDIDDTLIFENLTNEATITIELKYDKQYLKLSRDGMVLDSVTKFSMLPNTTAHIKVKLDKTNLDSIDQRRIIDKYITVTLQNEDTGKLVTRTV